MTAQIAHLIREQDPICDDGGWVLTRLANPPRKKLTRCKPPLFADPISGPCWSALAGCQHALHDGRHLLRLVIIDAHEVPS